MLKIVGLQNIHGFRMTDLGGSICILFLSNSNLYTLPEASWATGSTRNHVAHEASCKPGDGFQSRQ